MIRKDYIKICRLIAHTLKATEYKYDDRQIDEIVKWVRYEIGNDRFDSRKFKDKLLLCMIVERIN